MLGLTYPHWLAVYMSAGTTLSVAGFSLETACVASEENRSMSALKSSRMVRHAGREMAITLPFLNNPSFAWRASVRWLRVSSRVLILEKETLG